MCSMNDCLNQINHLSKSCNLGDILGCAVVKTSPSSVGGVSSIPCPGTKVLHAMWCGQDKEKSYNLRLLDLKISAK